MESTPQLLTDEIPVPFLVDKDRDGVLVWDYRADPRGYLPYHLEVVVGYNGDGEIVKAYIDTGSNTELVRASMAREWVAKGWARYVSNEPSGNMGITGVKAGAVLHDQGRLAVPLRTGAYKYMAYPWVIEDADNKLPLLLGVPFLLGYGYSSDSSTSTVAIQHTYDIINYIVCHCCVVYQGDATVQANRSF